MHRYLVSELVSSLADGSRPIREPNITQLHSIAFPVGTDITVGGSLQPTKFGRLVFTTKFGKLLFFFFLAQTANS